MSTRIRTLKDVEGNVFYPLTSGIAVAHGPVVDITDITSGGTYTSLSIALSAVPVNYQKGGMTLRYVDGNSGKYVEWFNTNSDWTTNLGSWIKVYNDGIFDVSANNIIDGQPSTFSSLGEILTNVDTLIPISARKGGMCIKFIQSPDNNYVQYRYMLDDTTTVATFTNVANWQGVDSKLVNGSKNLATSCAVMDELYKYTDETSSLTFTTDKYVDSRTGNLMTNDQTKVTDYIPIVANEKFKATIMTVNSSWFPGLAYYDENKSFLSGYRYVVADNLSNTLQEFVAPENAAYVRISVFKDEATRGEIQFYRYTSRITNAENNITAINEALSVIEANISAEQIESAKLSKKEITLVLTSPTVSEQSSTLWNFSYEVANPPATNCTATFNGALAYNDHIYMYDKHGAFIGQLDYAASRSSFTMLANTARVDVILRKNMYSNTADISISYTAPIYDSFFNTQLLSNLYIGDSNNIHYGSSTRVIARIAVKPNTDYALVTDSNFVLTSGSPAATNIYAADGTLLSHASITKKEVFKSGLTGYRITTPANAAYIYTTISTGASDIAGITIAEVVEYTALNIKTEARPLSVWCFGDSISSTSYHTDVYPWITNGRESYGLGGWISRFLLQTKIRPKKWYNFSVGGYTLSDITSSLDGNSYINEVNYAITAYNNGDVDAPDVVMIVGCTNDIDASPNRAVTNAEIEASSYENYEDYVEHTFFTQAGGDYYHRPLISIADVNKGKIIGAIRYIVEQLGTLFPDVRFMIATPPQSSRKTFQSQWQCVRDMKYAAMRLCLPCADVWSEAQMPLLWDYNADWNADNLNHRFLLDGIHTYDDGNAGTIVTGYIRQGNYIARKFNEFFDDITLT